LWSGLAPAFVSLSERLGSDTSDGRSGRHAVVRVEAEVAPASREEASVSGSTTIEFLAS
jgi:hypothetical protein